MTSPAPPPTNADQPTEMTDPVAQWHAIENAAGTTLAGRAYIAAATRHADQEQPPSDNNVDPLSPHDRRNVRWYRTALSNYHQLHDLDPFRDLNALRHHEESDRPRCTADPDTIRDWLTSPMPNQPGVTIAEELGIDELFEINTVDLNLHLSRLVVESQYAGIFGIPGNGIQLWHVAGDEGDLDGHLIIVHLSDGRRLVSEHIADDDLIDSDLIGLDAAVSVLENMAVHVNGLITTNTKPTEPTGLDRGEAARAFPSLDLSLPAPSPHFEPGPPQGLSGPHR